jgi:hypothetical protein
MTKHCFQFSKLFGLIDDVIRCNCGNYFSSDMFQKVKSDEDKQREEEERRLGKTYRFCIVNFFTAVIITALM